MSMNLRDKFILALIVERSYIFLIIYIKKLNVNKLNWIKLKDQSLTDDLYYPYYKLINMILKNIEYSVPFLTFRKFKFFIFLIYYYSKRLVF